MRKVFEIGKQFRNDQDQRYFKTLDFNYSYSSEFTTCELQMAYTYYDDLIDITR